MAVSNILTAGIELREALMKSPAVTAMTDRIFPVATRVDQKTPFVTYYRTGLDEDEVKGAIGPRTGYYQFQVYGESWADSVDLAMAILETLDGYRSANIRKCVAVDAVENYDSQVPAFMQVLSFKVKTN